MPIRASEKARYPKNWPEISKRIRFERAQGLCEFVMANGQRCDAPHDEVIFRDKKNLEQWRGVTSTDLCEGDDDYKAVKVILTVAHLNHKPEDCRDENLMAMCQLHHLRYDAAHHAGNSARTRRRSKNNLELFAVT